MSYWSQQRAPVALSFNTPYLTRTEPFSLLFTQTKPTLTLTRRPLHQTARMNWWVSIRRRSLVPKASGEEPKQLLILKAQVLGGTTGTSTAAWLLIMMATAAKPQLMMVRPVENRGTAGFVSATDSAAVSCNYNADLVLVSDCSLTSDSIAAVCSSQKHRFLRTSKPASTNSSNPDTHCQLIQRGDQSKAPFQHTLRGRVGKQSTVCIICTGYFFFFLSSSVSHLPGSSSQAFQQEGFL